jgi:hypothetical protein
MQDIKESLKFKFCCKLFFFFFFFFFFAKPQNGNVSMKTMSTTFSLIEKCVYNNRASELIKCLKRQCYPVSLVWN